MTGVSVPVDEALLGLKVLFLILLYLFIWRIVRTASKDVRVPQESFVLAPSSPAAAQLRAAQAGAPPRPRGRLVVVKSPGLEEGGEHVLDSAPVSIGRESGNDLELEGDDFASSRHARFEPREDGVWVEDVGSTNGTFVNGIVLRRPRKLVAGDIIRVGSTDLKFEQ